MTVDSERDVTFEWTYDERELQDAMLQLSFTYRGEDASLEKNFKEIIESWEADHKYEFTIGIPSG